MEQNDLAKVHLEVCRCCALNDPAIAAAISRIEAECGEAVTVEAKRCLDVCLEFGAVKVNGQVRTLRGEEAPVLVEEVRALLGR
jgi:hypothetical protein